MKKLLQKYEEQLYFQGKSEGTIDNYLRNVKLFLVWEGCRNVSGLAPETLQNHAAEEQQIKERVIQWRQYLQDKGYAAVTINAKLGALNSFLNYLGYQNCRAKYLRIQHRMFRKERQQLTKGEYEILRKTAETSGMQRLGLLMETICATGIRISELRYITVESAEQRRAEISLKGKIRTILIPEKLAKKLLHYARKKNVRKGEIFLTRMGKCISRKQVWAEMKELSRIAGVAASKVFPHNLRHLFATTFYGMYRDIVRLADMLGHSSMETTRIYLLTPEREHVRQLERMNLVT